MLTRLGRSGFQEVNIKSATAFFPAQVFRKMTYRERQKYGR